jgi:hypothetical protein
MLSAPPSTSQEIPTMLHLILKTYKTSISTSLSTHQQSPESLVPWGQLLFNVVGLEIPKDAVPADEDERERSEWWKAKKWAYATLGKLFHRCVDLTSNIVFEKTNRLIVIITASETHRSSLHQCKRIMVNSPNISSQYTLQRSSKSISNKWNHISQVKPGFRRRSNIISSSSSRSGS